MDEFPPGVALVVGGSGGIGRAVCAALAAAGTDVVLTYRRDEAGAVEAVAAVEAAGRRGRAEALDISDGDGVAVLVGSIENESRIHTVVVSAGADIAQVRVAEADPGAWATVLATELTGFLNVVRATVPHLRSHGGGAYVHLGSAGTVRWANRDGLSIVPKAAVQAAVRGVAREEGRHGIRANAVAVGVVEAGIFQRLRETTFDERWHEATMQALCLKRYGRAEDVADAVVFLASNRASYVTGQTLAVDGGYSV